jgi:uncharacterized protein (TIGR02588 family)
VGNRTRVREFIRFTVPGYCLANVKEIVGGQNAYIVTFELHNSGSQTLANVHVSARIVDGGREAERVQTVIDYLPGRSHQEGGFYFTNDLRAFKLEITPEGYQKP